MEKFHVKLARQPEVQIGCSYFAASLEAPTNALIVCISGIDNTQKIWFPMIAALRQKSSKNMPPILTYDRVRRGTSIGQNADVPGRPVGYGRDCLDAAHDIREVVVDVAKTRMNVPPERIDNLDIIFVASSLGCAIARLYADAYPRTVVGLLMLDSTIANSDTVSLFPNPGAPGFSAEKLPPGITAEMCVLSRKIIGHLYHTESPNKERIWRGNLPDLLPLADSPKLLGPRPNTPYVVVVEHDRSLFPMLCLEVRQTHSTILIKPLILTRFGSSAFQKS